MYSVIAFVGNDSRSRAVLLPLEHHHHFRAENWLDGLEQDQVLIVSAQLFSIAIGDWILRKVQQALKMGKLNTSTVQQQSYISDMLADIGIHTPLRWKHYTVQNKNAQLRVNHLERRQTGNVSNLQRQHEQPRRQQLRRQQILDWLQGRKLLYDEWLALVKDRMEEGSDRQISDRAEYTVFTMELIMLTWRRLLLKGQVRLRSAVEWMDQPARSAKPKLRCLRCYETKLIRAERPCRYCGEHCYYCGTCLQMGRARTCAALVVSRYNSPLQQHLNFCDSSPEALLNMESFGLSDAQHMATTQALHFVYQQLLSHSSSSGRPGRFSRNKQSSGGGSAELASQFLLWAVTGAGKTEMIFPLIAYMIELGGRVLLATPRRDVVLELSPRLHKAFPQLSIVTLYGGSEDRWQQGQLILATTHQLMRFQRAFDLVIIDELDAFPYHGDERLYRVAAQARTAKGVTILLSATPPAYLQRELDRDRLAHVKLPVRYHRHPLPVPVRLKVPLIVEQLSKQMIPRSLQQALTKSLGEDAQIFMFLQRIVHTEAYAKLLSTLFPHINIQATSSQDANRSAKVIAFRQREIRILVTTTILERGVTVPRSHVYICDAEAELFDEASLVQMAGRAGRSGDAPNGAVYFLSQQWSSAQKQAIRQINTMNKLALQQGYLLPQYCTDRERKGRKG